MTGSCGIDTRPDPPEIVDNNVDHLQNRVKSNEEEAQCE
jgi:hypothetical protein